MLKRIERALGGMVDLAKKEKKKKILSKFFFDKDPSMFGSVNNRRKKAGENESERGSRGLLECPRSLSTYK